MPPLLSVSLFLQLSSPLLANAGGHAVQLHNAAGRSHHVLSDAQQSSTAAAMDSMHSDAAQPATDAAGQVLHESAHTITHTQC